MTKFCFIALLILLFSSVQAKMYQYTDADGNVHFTDTPPIDANVQEREIKSGKPNDDSIERLHAEREARVKAKEAAAEAAIASELESKNKEIRDKNCNTAREQLHFYTEVAPSRRVRVEQDDGTYYWKTPEDIAEDTENARALVEEWCNPPKPKADAPAQP